MEVRHVKGCEYNDNGYLSECEEEVKMITEKLIVERKKNLQEHDNYCYNPSMQVCPNVYCNIFTDLCNWFGFKNCVKIDTDSLNTCFTDITNGGVGYYEKLIVLGGKILELFSELHFYNKYNSEKDEEVAPDLRNVKSVKEIVYHYLYVQKKKNRVIFKNSIYIFGYSYLYTPLFFNNKNSIIKYVKACVAYAVKFNKSNIFSWMPSLIEHIHHSQKLKISDIESENELIQDLQEYFGYSFDYILPRIAECFTAYNLHISNSHLTGLQIIKIFANEYFSHLADDVGVYGKEKVIWVKEETDAFLESKCIEIFSGSVMSISKYLNERGAKISKIRNIFEMLVSACWVLGDEKKNKIWTTALIQRLRQIQLLTQLTTLEKWSYSIKKYNDINMQNFINDVYNFNNINGSILSPFQLHNMNTYLPATQTEITEIPYYTTLADRYKSRFGPKEKNDSNFDQLKDKKKECTISKIINNVSEKMSKHFQPRCKKPIVTMQMRQNHYPNTVNIEIDKKCRYKQKEMPTETCSAYVEEETESEEESEGEDEETETETETEQEENCAITSSNPQHKKSIKQVSYSSESILNSNNPVEEPNGIPIKVKYIKDSDNDENSKYVIEIPKKNLKGKTSKSHIKAVLWGSSKKGLEINIPTTKNRPPQMKIT